MKTILIISTFLLLFSCSVHNSMENTIGGIKKLTIVKHGNKKNKAKIGFYAEGTDLGVYLPVVVFPRRGEKEYEYTTQDVPIYIINKTDKLFLVSIDEKTFSISSSVTSDDNYDNIANISPIKSFHVGELGEYALHPVNESLVGTHGEQKILKNQESYVHFYPKLKLVCYENSCALISIKLKYREVNSHLYKYEIFDIPISTGQNWTFWDKYMKKDKAATEIVLE